MDKLLVTVGGSLLIAVVYWFFLLRHEEVVEAGESLDIVVDGGYRPEVIKVALGKPVTLQFIRQDPTSCLEEVILGDFRIRKFLPLNQRVPITITPKRPGVFPFSCGMNMFHGKIVVSDYSEPR